MSSHPLVPLVALLALAFAAAGCGEEGAATEAFPVRFDAVADGDPLAGVRVSLRGGGELGVTDARGRLEVLLHGAEGQSVPIDAECPTGYRGPTQPPQLVLQRLQQLERRDQLRQVRIDLECRPQERTAMLLIRATGLADDLADIPVLVDGAEMARTDEFGLAHIPLTSPPDTAFEVVLRTEHLENVQPRNPPHTVTMLDQDEVFVIHQPFQRLTTKRRIRPRRVRRGPQLPQKIVAGQNPPIERRPRPRSL